MSPSWSILALLLIDPYLPQNPWLYTRLYYFSAVTTSSLERMRPNLGKMVLQT
jgi:hypothetical protein